MPVLDLLLELLARGLLQGQLELFDHLRGQDPGQGDDVHHHLVEQGVVAGVIAAGHSLFYNVQGVISSQLLFGFFTGLPVSFAHCFQHAGGHGLIGPGVGLVQEFFDILIILILYVDFIGLFPLGLIYGLGCGHLPAPHVFYELGHFTRTCIVFLFHAFDPLGIQIAGAQFPAYGPGQIFHTNLVGPLLLHYQGVGGLAAFLAHSQGKPAQVLEHVVIIHGAVDIGGTGVDCGINFREVLLEKVFGRLAPQALSKSKADPVFIDFDYFPVGFPNS